MKTKKKQNEFHQIPKRPKPMMNGSYRHVQSVSPDIIIIII